MNSISPEELTRYIRQVIAQEENAFNLHNGEPVDYQEFKTIVETVAQAAAHWAIGMARDDSEYDGSVAPPLPERPAI